MGAESVGNRVWWVGGGGEWLMLRWRMAAVECVWGAPWRMVMAVPEERLWLRAAG